MVCVCVCVPVHACLYVTSPEHWSHLEGESHSSIAPTFSHLHSDDSKREKQRWSEKEKDRERFDVNNDSNENHLHSDSYWSPLLTSKAITDYSNKNRLHKYRSRNRQTESQAE